MKTLFGVIGNHPRPIGAVVGGFLVWLCDVFTVHGLLVAVGLESGDDLNAPWATRLVWWVLFYALGSGWAARLMWREAKLSFTSVPQLWAASHVDVVKRIGRRVAWWRDGVRVVIESRRRHRAATVPATVPGGSRTVPEPVHAETVAA